MAMESYIETEFRSATISSTSCHDNSASYAIMVVTMVIGCFGFVLNIFSFFVWRAHRNKIAPHYYLLALAVSDTIATFFDGIIDSLDCITGDKLFASKKWPCFADLGLDFLTTFATYWVITLIAVDRCLGLLYPQSYKTRFSKPSTAAVTLGITMFVVYVCGGLMILGPIGSVDSDAPSTDDDCGMGSNEKGYRQFLLYGSTILGAITPLVIVIASTVIILYEIHQQQRSLTFTVRESGSKGTEDSSNSRVISTASRDRETVIRSRATTTSSSINTEQLSDFRNLTITISVVFVLFCGTAQILTIYSHGVVSKRKTVHPVADALDELFNVLNSSSNFILYFLSSRLFRKEMKDFVAKTRNRVTGLWRRCLKLNSTESTHGETQASAAQLADVNQSNDTNV